MNSTRDKASGALIISWLGFGMALALFLLVWFVNLLVYNWTGCVRNPFPGLYIILFFLGGFVGILSLIFSIIGLSMAVKRNSTKWIGATGIVLFVLSLFSFFIPIAFAGMNN